MHANLSFLVSFIYKYELKLAFYIEKKKETSEISIKRVTREIYRRLVMALNWLLHSAYNIVLGYPHVKTTKEEVSKSMKLSYDNDKESTRSMDVSDFQMPLHYPRYNKMDYSKMEEWRVDLLLQQYGLKVEAKSIDEKRAFAMGAFLWPDQI